ncbi:TPA: histidinol-phosphate transaminase, partial [Pseudomonas aeruginosa]|nr:histidinol-phosphate transaminase [Pseudomonas aeruginosa]HEJ2775886.1 histidinol-phosphate transaminase [Pseudomonas aeruginosa]
MIDYLSLAVSEVRQLAPYVPGKAIEELERETGLRADEIIKLASNESPLPPNPRVVSAIQRALGQITRYPDGNGFVLKRKLAQKFGLDPAGITLGNGSNDLLIMIAQAFLREGRNAVMGQYAFSVYASATASVGALVREVPAKGYGNDLDQILTAIDQHTRVVFIANPNNPTGTWFDRDTFGDFMSKVPHETLVVLDEAYIEYADDPALPNGLDYLSEHPNLIVCRSLCKAYGLAGLRVGYAASSAQLADVLNRVRQPFNVNCLALAAACAALDDDAYLELGRRINREGLQQLREGLSQLGLSWLPSRTNFVTVDFAAPAVPVYEALLAKGIIVRPLAGYGMPNHLRISVGLDSENGRLLDALGEILSSVSLNR